MLVIDCNLKYKCKSFTATILPSLESGQDVHNEEEEEEDDDGRHAAGLHTITEEEETGNRPSYIYMNKRRSFERPRNFWQQK